MTILIAEDDEMLRGALVGLFQRSGYAVREAIRILDQHATIDLVISDYYMADGDGGDVLEFAGIDELLVKPFSVRACRSGPCALSAAAGTSVRA